MKHTTFKHLLLLTFTALLFSGCKTTDTMQSTLDSIKNMTGSDVKESTSPAPQSTDSVTMLVSSNEAENDLMPDKMCEKVEEDRDIWGRAMRYGGEQAKARLRSLLLSNFKHSDLTESDKQLLRYIAYTTIWVPSEVEVAMGKLYLQASGAIKDEKYKRSIKRMLKDSQAQADTLISHISGFPGEATVMFDEEIKDGAFARVGGLIVVSQTFLQKMDKHKEVQQVVLSHELSHLYKRHSLKELQVKLVMTAEGWEIAKTLFEQIDPDRQSFFSSTIQNVEGIFNTGKQAKQLYDFISNQQLTFNQTQELEADACGLRWLAREGVPPLEAWQIFEGMLQVDESPSDEQDYRRYHPTSEERAQNARAVITSIQP